MLEKLQAVSASGPQEEEPWEVLLSVFFLVTQLQVQAFLSVPVRSLYRLQRRCAMYMSQCLSYRDQDTVSTPKQLTCFVGGQSTSF